MSTLKSIKKGDTVKITLTSGDAVKGAVKRIAKRGGDVAAFFLEDGTRIGVAKIATLNGTEINKIAKSNTTSKTKGKRKKRTALKGNKTKNTTGEKPVTVVELRKAANAEIKTIRACVNSLRRNLNLISKANGKKDEDYDVAADLSYTEDAFSELKEALDSLSPSNYK